MGRRRKTAEEAVKDDPELARIVAQLQASGGGAEYFYEIRRRAPGVSGYFPIWKKKLPAADVVDVEEFCRTQGGPGYEYLVILKDAMLKTVLDKNDLPVQQRIEPLTVANPVTGGVPSMAGPRPEMRPEVDAMKAEAARLRAEAEAKADLARAKREHERIMRGIEAGELEDDRPPGRGGRPGQASAEWPFGPGVPFYVDAEGMARRMNGRGGPPGRDDRGDDRRDSMEMFMQFMATMNDSANRAADRQMQLLTAMMGRGDGFEKYLPMLLGNQMSPDKMMNFLGPAMTQAMQAGTAGMKSVLESAMDTNGAIQEALIKRMMDDGRDPDEVDKVKKWMDLGNDFLSRATKTVLGRDSIMKREVKIPLEDGKKPAALPPPSKSPDQVKAQAAKRAAEGDAARPAELAAPATASPAPAPAPNPAADLEAEAKAESERRVKAFLGIFEREMRIGSDPGPLFDPDGEAGRQFWDLFDLLPLPLRAAIEKGDMAGIYTAAQEYAGDVVERINAAMSDPTKGEARRDWSRRFWLQIAEANALDDTDDDDEEDDDEDDVEEERKAE